MNETKTTGRRRKRDGGMRLPRSREELARGENKL